MDFFEKAHVVKRDSSRKDHKSEVAVKKQLKQMLNSYKKSDNNLIKSCEDKFDPTKFNEDSSSVSGFSDLNLTNSSIEIDETIETLGSDSEEENTSHVEKHKDNNQSDSVPKDSNKSENSVKSLESISEVGDDIQTLSDNVSLEVTLDSCSIASDMISLDTSLAESITENDFDKSELFDADGSLANKILEKLEKKGVVKKRCKKRKLENQKTEILKHNFAETRDIPDVQTEDGSSDADDEANVHSMSDTNSSDFVSLLATDMAAQSLSDILGEYRHPTTKNLPSESQNQCSTNNSGIFSVEDMNVEDMQIQEDESVDSQLDLNSDNDLPMDEVINISDIDTSIHPHSGSTSVYDTTLQSEDTSDKEMSVQSMDNSFLSSVKVYYGQASCILVLKHPAELYIHGKVTVKALGGTMEIFGHTLKDKPCNVYASNYSYAHCLKTVENETESSGLFRKLASEGVSVADAEEIVTGIGQYDGVVSLKKLTSSKMDFVENFMVADLFSKMGKNVDNSLRKPSQLLGCSLYSTRPWTVFEELSCWKQAVKCGSVERSRGIMCGGKGLGKSTFLRYCVNRLLHLGPVLVVDLDPGQAEFTVAGNISATVVEKPLLGPNFTHLKTPVRMLNIGMINTMDNPRRYAAAVSDLIRHCNNDEQLKSMPWLINTMGMCNAMGLKFMTLVILQAQPTYLFQIDNKNPKKRFETYLNPHNVLKLYEDSYKYDYLFKNVRNPEPNYKFFVANHAGSSGKNKSSLSPRDERYLNFLAYFGELLKSRHDTGLLGITPFEVKLGDLHIGLNIKITDEAVTKVINGKIIALCQLTTLDNGGKVFTLRDKPLVCHGHGLIRGVDLEKGTLYILTPTPVEKLSAVDTLVYADWVPELRGQEKHLPDGITVPYRTDTTYQQRQLMFAPRRRFNPLQLLKMSRNS